MKGVIYYLLIVSVVCIFFCCKKEVDDPNINSFTFSPSPAEVNELVTFIVHGTADHFVIWTGDSTHNYENYQLQIINPVSPDTNMSNILDNGDSLDDSVYFYRYKKAGAYNIVLIATNIGDDGNEMKSNIQERSITILNSN